MGCTHSASSTATTRSLSSGHHSGNPGLQGNTRPPLSVTFVDVPRPLLQLVLQARPSVVYTNIKENFLMACQEGVVGGW